MSDLYNSPEDYGLKIFGEVEAERNYDFDMFVIWEDASGLLLYATDSGCSCPSPFEDTSVTDLKPILFTTFGNFAYDLTNWNHSYERTKTPTAETYALQELVWEHLKEQTKAA